MNCKVCGKDAMKHTESQVNKCLGKAIDDLDDKDVWWAMSKAGVQVGVNFRKKKITYQNKDYMSEDVNLDLLRICLTGENIPEIKKIEDKAKKEKVDQEQWEEEEGAKFEQW